MDVEKIGLGCTTLSKSQGISLYTNTKLWILQIGGEYWEVLA
jgi:hypothetical protein